MVNQVITAERKQVMTGISISGMWLHVKHSEITSDTKAEEIEVVSINGMPAHWFGEIFIEDVKDGLHEDYKDRGEDENCKMPCECCGRPAFLMNGFCSIKCQVLTFGE
jgi:hypothetical protein